MSTKISLSFDLVLACSKAAVAAKESLGTDDRWTVGIEKASHMRFHCASKMNPQDNQANIFHYISINLAMTWHMQHMWFKRLELIIRNIHTNILGTFSKWSFSFLLGQETTAANLSRISSPRTWLWPPRTGGVNNHGAATKKQRHHGTEVNRLDGKITGVAPSTWREVVNQWNPKPQPENLRKSSDFFCQNKRNIWKVFPMAAFKPRGTPISARKKNMKNIASGLGCWDGSRLSLNRKEPKAGNCHTWHGNSVGAVFLVEANTILVSATRTKAPRTSGTSKQLPIIHSFSTCWDRWDLGPLKAAYLMRPRPTVCSL